MCGAIVFHDIEIPARICMSCGREQKFIGSVCKDCENAIAKGAVTLKKAAQRNIKTDKPPVFAKCPGAEICEALFEKALKKREAKRANNRRWSKKKRQEHPEVFKAYRERHKEQIREYSKEYQKREVRKQYMKQYRQVSESYRARQYGYFLAKKDDPAYREKRREQSRKYRAQRRAEFLALSPEEQAARKAEYKKSERYQRILELNRAYKARLKEDPERRAIYLEKQRAHNARPEIREKRKLYQARYYAKKKLIQENEAIEQQRALEAIRNEQGQIDGAADCRHAGEIWGGCDGGDHTGKSELGVALDRQLPCPEGPQMAEVGAI